jgi:hypothetical protein
MNDPRDAEREARAKLAAHLRSDIDDPNIHHSAAETLLQEFLHLIGEHEIADLWKEAREGWWYA